MNTTKFLASSLMVLGSLAASSAFADSYDREHPLVSNTPSTVTRAQVKAELLAAQKDGSAAFNSRTYPVINAVGAAKTRAEVQAELAMATKEGSIPQYRG